MCMYVVVSIIAATAGVMSADKFIGKFIVVEGRDGIGKSTLVTNLKRLLMSKSISVETIALPDRSLPTGMLIDSYLRKEITVTAAPALHMLFSVNRIECCAKTIVNKGSNVCVIADRYALSGYVYATIDVGRVLAKSLRKSEKCAGVRRPDITVILHSTDDSLRRKTDELYETERFQKKVSAMYIRLAPPSAIVVDVGGMNESQVLDIVFNRISDGLINK